MGKQPSEYYWDKNCHKFPFQTTVKHLSSQDPDPREIQQKIDFNFIRVPFNGESHWGFLSQNHLDRFKKLVGLP